MKNKLKIIYIYDYLYKTNIIVFIGDEKKAADYALKHYNIRITYASNEEGRTWHVENFGSIIWLEKFNLSAKYISILAHEVTHVSITTMQRIHHPIKKQTVEPLCYHIEWLIKEIITEYKNKK